MLQLLDCRRATEQHGALAGQNSAIAVRKSNVAIFDLTLAAFAAHLADRFYHHQEAVHSRMAV